MALAVILSEHRFTLKAAQRYLTPLLFAGSKGWEAKELINGGAPKAKLWL